MQEFIPGEDERQPNRRSNAYGVPRSRNSLQATMSILWGLELHSFQERGFPCAVLAHHDVEPGFELNFARVVITLEAGNLNFADVHRPFLLARRDQQENKPKL